MKNISILLIMGSMFVEFCGFLDNPREKEENINNGVAEKQVTIFEKRYSVKSVQTETYLVDSNYFLKDPPVAKCYTNSNHIAVNREYWEEISKKKKQISITHELGHCVFDLSHDQKLLTKKCPNSLMYANPVPVDCYEKYKSHYIQNMKEKIQSSNRVKR